mgnify:CR=1 FL=1
MCGQGRMACILVTDVARLLGQLVHAETDDVCDCKCGICGCALQTNSNTD